MEIFEFTKCIYEFNSIQSQKKNSRFAMLEKYLIHCTKVTAENSQHRGGSRQKETVIIWRS